MNILYLTGHLEMGGTEIYTMNMAISMLKKGHNVVWASDCTGFLKPEIIKKGIILEKCNLSKRNPLSMLSAVLSLRKIIRKYNINIIHSSDAFSSFISVLANRKNKKNSPKLIWSCVGIGMHSYFLMYKLCAKKLTHIIAISCYIRNRLIEGGFNPAQIDILYHFSTLKESTVNREDLRKQFGIESDEIVVGTVGRLVELKGNSTVITAIKNILDIHPKTKLMIVGDGPEKNNLNKMVNDYKIIDRVIFTGARTDIENMYTIFDIVAFPTYMEASGYIPLEAMYYKKPIVASLTGGVPELVLDGYNGIVIPPAIPSLWSDALCKIIESDDIKNKFITNGIIRFQEKFASEHVINKLENIYVNCIGG